MFADYTCIHVSDAGYGNVLSTLQLSADEVFNWATEHPPSKDKIHDHYYVAKASMNSTF